MSKLYQKILVPLDGSDLASRALPYATELAELSGAQLFLLRVAPDSERDYQMTSDLQVVNLGLEEQQASVDYANQWIEQIASDLSIRGLRAQAIVDVGKAADIIIDVAAERQVDLIVMSTHGRTGIARWAYGSVANKVLAAAPCPVLLVRPQTNQT